jgi:hypothetical protein
MAKDKPSELTDEDVEVAGGLSEAVERAWAEWERVNALEADEEPKS